MVKKKVKKSNVRKKLENVHDLDHLKMTKNIKIFSSKCIID